MNQAAEGTRRLNLAVGIVVALFALIGVISVIVGAVSFISSRVGDNSAEIEEYKAFIAPVIMNDPEPFDDVTKASQPELISIAIWSFLSGDIDPDTVRYSENGMIISEDAVEKEFARLFGTDVAPLHASVEGGEGIEFEYDRDKEAYTVPITGIDALYSPTITELKEKGSTVILTVGYLVSQDWILDKKGNMVPPEPSKYMNIYLRSGSDGYYISAIKATDALEEATHGQTATQEKSKKDSTAKDTGKTSRKKSKKAEKATK